MARPDDPFVQFVGYIAAGGGLAGAGAAVTHWGPRLWDRLMGRPASEAAVRKAEAEVDLIKAQAISEVVKGAKEVLGLQANEITDLRTVVDRLTAEGHDTRARAERAEAACAELRTEHEACTIKLTAQGEEIAALRAAMTGPIPPYEPKAATPRPRKRTKP